MLRIAKLSGPTLVACLLFLPVGAIAHAPLKSASPRQDAVVARSLSEIRLEFREPVEASVSYVELANAKGEILFSSKDGRACDGTICILKVGGLLAGEHRVLYRILSQDGHVVEGGYSFAVAE